MSIASLRISRTAAVHRAPSAALALTMRAALAAASTAISLAGAVLLLAAIWWIASAYSSDLPGPLSTLRVFWALVRDPFYDNGPNDKGIGLQLYASLKRVTFGFVLGSLVAIPLGVLLGSSALARRFVDPVVQVLRPVSPLAWFPIGLAVFRSTGDATIFIIFITSLWPTVLNTSLGVSSIPESHKQVARVFQFSRWTYLTRVVVPFSLPYVLTGLRLSVGIAWLVLVAGEMLSGGSGIGFFVWDSWNALNLERVMSAVLLIGIVGLVLDRGFAWIAERVSYEVA